MRGESGCDGVGSGSGCGRWGVGGVGGCGGHGNGVGVDGGV